MKNAHGLRAFRRWCLLAASCGLLAVGASAAQYARGKLIPELQLKNGTVLHGVTVVSVNANTVLARWDGGMGSILLSQLPPQMRADLAPPVVAPPAAAAPAPVAAAPVDPKLASAEIPTEIKLTNGFVMRKSTISRWNPDSVLVSYQGGTVVVQFRNISPEQRAIFEARRDEAMATQAREDSAPPSEQQIAAKDKQAKEETEAQAKDEADRKAEEIKNGIAFHYLVKGMTKEETILAFGKAPQEHGDTFFYTLRGKDRWGNACDRTITFKDGVIVSWRDAQADGSGTVDH